MARPAPLSGRLYVVFVQWLPLWLSFALMMCEGPALQSAIGRLPDAPLHLAAWGLTMSLSLLVESPVIMLLTTSIALVQDRPTWQSLRSFTLRLCVSQTVLAALVAFTPLFRVVTVTIMRQPLDIVAQAQPAMEIMLLWTASIAWRRFCQGILVRHGHTRLVSAGTAVRLFSVSSVATVLVLLHPLPGVRAAACAIMCGVVAEAISSHLFVRPVLRDSVLTVDRGEPPLTRAAIWRFHRPLALTTLLTLLAGPLVASALARLPQPEITLAAWPVAFTAVFVLRSGGFAMQEITVAQSRFPERVPTLRTFAWLVGVAGAALALGVTASSALPFYLEHAVNLPRHLWPLVRQGMFAMGLLPLLTSLACWARGLRVSAQETPRVYQAMGVSLGVQAVVLTIGVLMQAPAMPLGGVALTVASAAELAWLRAPSRAVAPAASG